MGLSASQARLLSITARITDNELRSQFITNAKMRLAGQSSDASAEYMSALNSTQLLFSSYDANGAKTYEKMTAGFVITYSPLKNQYGLINNSGQLMVSSLDKDNYAKSGTLTAFLRANGVEFVNNPKHIIALENLYGERYEKFYDENNPFGLSEDISDGMSQLFSNVAIQDTATGVWSLNPNLVNIGMEQFQEELKGYVAYVNDQVEKLRIGDIDSNVYITNVTNYYNDSAYGQNRETMAQFDSYLKNLKGGVSHEDWYNIFNYEKDEGLVPRWAETLNNAPLYDNGELPDLSSAIELASLFALSSALNLYDDLIANAENAIKNAIDGTYPYWGDSDTHAGQEAAVKQINDYYEGSKTKQTNIGTNITNLQTIVSQMPVGIRKTELGTLISQLQQISGATDSIVKKMETFNNTIGQWNASNAPYKQDSREIDKDIIRAAFGENSAWPKGGGTDWDKINNTDTSLPANRKGGVAKAIDDAKMTYSNTGIDQYQIQTQLEEKLNEFQWLDNYNTHAQQFVRWLNSCEQFKNYVQYGLETLPSKEIPRENDPKAQWYTNLWYRMGGISETKKEEPSTKFKVLDDSKMNNPDYLQYALETGTLAMEQVVFSEKGSGLYPGLKTTDWKACTFDNISNISRQDNTLAVAKAEVKYKKAVEEIQATDKRYDLDLKKLDTQHNALQTEFDSIKTIINKNAERSFKAFS